MAYEPKTWQCGEVVTADDLNHIERGIAEAGGALVVRVDHTEGTFPNVNAVYDKTWREVYNAITNGVVVVFPTSNPTTLQSQSIATNVSGDEETGIYTVTCLGVDLRGEVSIANFYACSADGYLQTAECESSGGGGSESAD